VQLKYQQQKANARLCFTIDFASSVVNIAATSNSFYCKRNPAVLKEHVHGWLYDIDTE